MEFQNKTFLDKKTRFEMLSKLYSSVNFDNTFWMLGCGAVGTSLLYMLCKIVNISKEIIIIDKNKDIINKINEYIQPNIKNNKINFIHAEIKKENYMDILKNVNKDDIIIDCSYNVSTNDLLMFCNQKGCSYINSSIEDWDSNEQDPLKYSLMYKHQNLIKINSSFPEKKTNFIISMGCNPGNVSIWTKFGLFILGKNRNIKYKDFSELAYKLGVNVIHISEKDTQITTNPKKINEYCNTWSSTAESMYVEAIGPVEASWGTHEHETNI